MRRPQRGLTLLETLVTLVIVAIVAGLMSEGMYQLSRVEQRMGSGQLQAQLGRLHLLWVQQSLEGLQTAERESPDRFQGGPRELQALSSMLPMPERQGAMPMRLSLRYRTDVDRTELSMEFSLAGAMPRPVVLARWPGNSGNFSYLDEQGQWTRDWAPANLSAPSLPRAIAIRQRDDMLLLVAAPQASAQTQIRRIDIGKLP